MKIKCLSIANNLKYRVYLNEKLIYDDNEERITDYEIKGNSRVKIQTYSNIEKFADISLLKKILYFILFPLIFILLAYSDDMMKIDYWFLEEKDFEIQHLEGMIVIQPTLKAFRNKDFFTFEILHDGKRVKEASKSLKLNIQEINDVKKGSRFIIIAAFSFIAAIFAAIMISGLISSNTALILISVIGYIITAFVFLLVLIKERKKYKEIYHIDCSFF